MAGVDLTATPYWSDYQTNEQYFGLLSFDPGEEESVSYPDGDKSEWTEEDRISEQNGVRLSMKQDERYLYFLVEQEGFNVLSDKLYIPVDTTPKSGSLRAGNLGVEMDRAADFVVELDGPPLRVVGGRRPPEQSFAGISAAGHGLLRQDAALAFKRELLHAGQRGGPEYGGRRAAYIHGIQPH